jgi:hypothetical protein
MLYKQLTFYQNPTSPAPYRIQIGGLQLKEILKGTQLGRGHWKGGYWDLGVSEEALQFLKLKF